jgi:hypothetical protein
MHAFLSVSVSKIMNIIVTYNSNQKSFWIEYRPVLWILYSDWVGHFHTLILQELSKAEILVMDLNRGK